MNSRLILFLGNLLAVAAMAHAEGGATAAAPAANAADADMDSAVAAFLQPSTPAPGDDALRQKMKERYDAAVRLLQLRVEAHRKGLSDTSSVFEAARVVAEAKLDLAQNTDERKAVLDPLVNILKVVEDRMQKELSSGFGSESDLQRAKLARLTAEVELLKLSQNGAASTTQSH
jgi:hypothetical protein